MSGSAMENLIPPAAQRRTGAARESWLFTTDPKRLARLHLVWIGFATWIVVFLGFGLQLLPLASRSVGLELGEQRQVFSMHGLVGVFLFAIPAIPTILGNLLLPRALGVTQMAWPKLNLLAFHLFLFGVGSFLVALLFAPASGGWSLAPPFSLGAEASPTWSVIAVVSVLSSIGCSSLAFLGTIVLSRKTAGSWSELSSFSWALALSSVLQLVLAPVLAVLFVMLLAERAGTVDLFAGNVVAGDLLFERWFWSWGQPAVVAVLLPACGFVADLVRELCGRAASASRALLTSYFALIVLGGLAPGVAFVGLDPDAASSVVPSAFALAAILPLVAILADVWAVLRARTPALSTPLCYVLSWITMVGVSCAGLAFLAVLPIGLHVRHTAFLVAEMHYLALGVLGMALLAGVYHAWDRRPGAEVDEKWARIGCVCLFFGMHLAFIPLFVLGYLGRPRRTFGMEWSDGSGWQWTAVAGGAFLLVGFGVVAWNLASSFARRGAAEGAVP